MGNGYKISCMACSHEDRLLTGSGFYHSSYDRCLSSLHPKARWALEEVVGKEPVHDYSFSYSMASCTHCCKMAEKKRMTVTFGDGRFHETPCLCPKCRHEMKPFNVENLSEIPCPNCKGRCLKAQVDLMWD